MAQTLEQKRAQHAWEKAKEGVSAFGKEYVNSAKALPALIMNSGLMQVMAYLRDKGRDKKNRKEKRHEMLARHLREWLHEQCGTPSDFEGFMTCLQQAEPRDFQHITTEAMAWLRWLRQMAPARQGGTD